MTQTCLGICCDTYGLATAEVAVQGTNGPEVRRRHWATPGTRVADMQDDVIAIDLDHDPSQTVGEVVYLERDRDGNVWCVGHVDDAVEPAVNVRVANRSVAVPHPLYWSVSRYETPEHEFLLHSIALGATPARISARPVKILAGDLNFHREPPREWEQQVRPHEFELLQRACENLRSRRRYGGPIRVHDRERQAQFDWLEHRRDLIPQPTPEEARRRPVPPQCRPGWQPGMLEWSQHRSSILSVS